MRPLATGRGLARTKRAKLIAVLERAQGRFRHRDRAAARLAATYLQAAITGLRHVGHEVTRNKDRSGAVKFRRSSHNKGSRSIVVPRWSRCAIAPSLLIGRSEASTGRRDCAGG
jgi:hypothetical protein